MSDPEVINQVVQRALQEVHTMLVGRVESVGINTIDVQPVTKKILNGSIINMPLFREVPPVFIQGGASYEAYPIAAGDYCLLFVSESNIERWYAGQDDMQPNEDRMFDYSDSFALVGVNPLSAAKIIPPVTTAIGDKIIQGDYTHTGNVIHTGDITHVGNYGLTGNLTVTGDIILNGVSLKDFVEGHTHGGVKTGGGNTAVPNPL